ncbi:hypothetical protein C5167_018456 [Papaver somniferum]|uniref:SP-RING-type domain-containing protein n=1 Tax=Papaver somniferum TaxID=3469 RepID=A0A4Y7IMX4_PAPSO|nr:hypothetical protein C5167_018456 [Papaver somniferum]
MSGSRIKIAGRFKPCIHMGCIDLESFVELNQKSRKMGSCGEDVTEIDVKPDGSWRAMNDREHMDLAQWHFPDGSLSVETGKNIKPDLESSKQIKHDGPSEEQSPFKL